LFSVGFVDDVAVKESFWSRMNDTFPQRNFIVNPGVLLWRLPIYAVNDF